jgi:polyphenol oxidase
MDSPIITYPGYNPQQITYGFIGKKFKLSKHKYRGKDRKTQENRKKVALLLGVKKEALSTLHQVHSNKCITIKKLPSSDKDIQADGQVTNKKGVVLALLTADCIPILFIDLKNNIVGAAHSGWKGALSGIIFSTVSAMKKLGSKETNIDVVIGPCIHQESYEVDSIFFNKFIQESHNNSSYFKSSTRQNHYMFDLPTYVKDKLCSYSFNNIFDINMNTFKNEKFFFSYRRCTLRDEKLDGHILSVVGLKGAEISS